MNSAIAEVATRRAAPAVRQFAERYVGYRYQGFAPGIHRGLPSRYLTLIVSLGPPVDIAGMPGRRQPPARLQAFAGGLHSSPALIAHDGSQFGVSLDVDPLAVRRVFRIPAAALASTVVDLCDVLGRRGQDLVEGLAEAPTWERRFDLLDSTLSAAMADSREPRPEVAWSWRRLLSTAGAVGVSALAREVGWSRRHLAESFRDELGLSPKVAARVLRFDRARKLLQRPEGLRLAEVAAASGYYDQAHLNRDWRALAGCPPGVWLRTEELPSVQDPGVEPPPS